MTSAAPTEPGAAAQGSTGSPGLGGDGRHTWLRGACSWQWQIAGSSPESKPLPVALQSSAAPSLSLEQEKCSAAEVL